MGMGLYNTMQLGHNMACIPVPVPSRLSGVQLLLEGVFAYYNMDSKEVLLASQIEHKDRKGRRLAAKRLDELKDKGFQVQRMPMLGRYLGIPGLVEDVDYMVSHVPALNETYALAPYIRKDSRGASGCLFISRALIHVCKSIGYGLCQCRDIHLIVLALPVPNADRLWDRHCVELLHRPRYFLLDRLSQQCSFFHCSLCIVHAYPHHVQGEAPAAGR